MTAAPPTEMRLYNTRSERLYINAEERRSFLLAADQAAPEVRSLCYMLAYTGCRLSEALNLRPQSIQAEARLISIRTLKRRRTFTLREVPVPRLVLAVLSEAHLLPGEEPAQPLWRSGDGPLTRSTAYRWIKAVMAEAGIAGAQACPKGLRHGFGVQAIRAGVPLNMLQKWMGHAALETTAIYANALGAEELAIADRMWREPLGAGSETG